MYCFEIQIENTSKVRIKSSGRMAASPSKFNFQHLHSLYSDNMWSREWISWSFKFQFCYWLFSDPGQLILSEIQFSHSKMQIIVAFTSWDAQVVLVVKNQCRRHKRHGFNPWVGKIPCRREWLPTLLFWPGKFHWGRSLVGYSPWGCKQSDTSERLTLFTFIGLLSELY